MPQILTPNLLYLNSRGVDVAAGARVAIILFFLLPRKVPRTQLSI